MKNVSLRLIARLILHMEYLCLVGLILFTEGHIPVKLVVNPSFSLSEPYAGRLEIQYLYRSNGPWGTVCANSFTDAAARVVCAMLGFRTGSFIQNAFGSGSGSGYKWLIDVSCTGSESNISSCSRSSWSTYNCRHDKEVSISCGYTPVRLVNPSSSLPNTGAGRLEVWYNGIWNRVCADQFTYGAALVVCNSLGFGRTGKVIQNSYGPGPGPGSEQIWLRDVNCARSETSIDSCSRIDLGTHNCQVSNEVSIECDVDECATGQNECERTTGTCVNTVGSYNCSCWSGYENIRLTTCRDIDECTTGQHRCVVPGTNCVNTNGSYYCSDIDECSIGRSLCDKATTTCVNMHGSYRCSCGIGYGNLRSTTCTDIDECTTGSSQCDKRTTTCLNTVGSYECQCKDGHRRINSAYCEDINECTNGQSQCDLATTTCVNTVGSYRCPCKSGFKYLNFSSCAETVECENGEQLCDKSTTICFNSTGSYHCVCRAGYKRKNNTACSDMDECNSGESKCDPMSTDCINTIGNYICSCKEGFTYLNETTCLSVEESSQGRYGLGATVGSSVGVFLVVASAATLFLVFYWKRRNEVNQSKRTESSGVDNGPGVANSDRTKIYESLDQTPLEMRNETIYTQLNPRTLLPVSP